MKKQLFFALFFGGLTSLAVAQTGTSENLAPEKSAEVDRAVEVVEALTAPSMKGRGYASGGDKLAADYIANEFKSIGVEPVGASYLHGFNVSVNTFPDRMEVQLNNNELLTAGVDYIVDAASPAIMGVFKPVIVNRKQVSDLMVLRDKIRDAKETFILVDNTSREGETKEQSARIDKLIDELKTKQEIQLRGVIVYDNSRLPVWSSATHQNPRPTIYLYGETDLSSLKTVKVTIDATLQAMHATQNVMAMVKGMEKPDSFIVFTAHYDHVGMMGKNVYYPGANNGASGVAMLLALAKHYQLIKPKYSVLFVAFGGYELGNAGANAFIAAPPVLLENIRFSFTFDFAAKGSDGLMVVTGTKYPELFKQMNQINTEYKLLPAIKSAPGAPPSEYNVLSNKGIPSWSIFSLGGGSPALHNLNDTADTAPFTKFKNYLNLIIRLVEKIK
ncbi:MAG: M28 family peptidase [Prevotellaceae bacterium]|jgi:hypothetical protein|nr:M28 family peptidase [Prevotellaceae bacterium]